MEYLTHPMAILVYVAVTLAVILPWLKQQAKKTETVVDDSIIKLLQVWLTGVAKTLMGSKKLFLLVICVFLFQGCVFTGYGVNYDTGNYLSVTAEDGQKKFIMMTTVTDDSSSTIDQVAEKVVKMFREWIDQ